MRRRWKIALGVLVLLILAGTGLFTWMLLKPNAPASIVEPGPTGRRIADGSLFGNFYPAPGGGRRPAILLLGGSEGGLGADVQGQALLLQQAGYNVLQLGYFNVPGLPSKLERVPLELFYGALDWLKRQPQVEPAALAVIGYSKGAEAALLVATSYSGIRAVVAGMPSSVAWDGLSAQSYLLGGVSSWSRDGEQLPSLPYGAGDSSEHLLPRFVNGLERLDAHPQTIIPVERYSGRMLMICGELDLLWPACRMGRMVEARARTSGRPEVRLLVYPNAGHGVMGAPLPPEHRTMRAWANLGGTPQANAEARADSWRQIMEFLAESFGTTAD
jgi:hypothetical protein